jgi:GT2 family glycosyltransferase
VTKLTVIIPCYNPDKFLEGLLYCIKEQTFKDYKVIIIDDKSKTPIKVNDDNITVIRNKNNLGYSDSVRKAYKDVKTKYVMLLNIDITFEKDFFEKMIKKVETSKDIALVCPLQYKHAKDLIKIKHMLYRLKKSVSITLTGNNVTVPAEYHPKDKKLVRIFYNGLFIAKTKYIGKNIFPKGLYMYCEDLYLCWKMNANGHKVYVATDIHCWHYGGSSKMFNPEINEKASYHGTKNKVMVPMMLHDKKTYTKILPLVIMSESLYLLHDPKKIWIKIKAYHWVIKNRKKIKREKVPDITHMMSHKIYDEDEFNMLIVKMFNKIAELYVRWIF